MCHVERKLERHSDISFVVFIIFQQAFTLVINFNQSRNCQRVLYIILLGRLHKLRHHELIFVVVAAIILININYLILELEF